MVCTAWKRLKANFLNLVELATSTLWISHGAMKQLPVEVDNVEGHEEGEGGENVPNEGHVASIRDSKTGKK